MLDPCLFDVGMENPGTPGCAAWINLFCMQSARFLFTPFPELREGYTMYMQATLDLINGATF